MKLMNWLKIIVKLFLKRTEPKWHMCPNCCKSVIDGQKCTNPRCDNGWMT